MFSQLQIVVLQLFRYLLVRVIVSRFETVCALLLCNSLLIAVDTTLMCKIEFRYNLPIVISALCVCAIASEREGSEEEERERNDANFSQLPCANVTMRKHTRFNIILG